MPSNFSYYEYNVDSYDPEDQDTDQRILLHMDIDYFFAQVEILKDPELRGKPVIVGHTKARETGRGVVLTCSYEAREFGVHSGQAMKIALDRCPDAVIVASSYSDYKSISSTIMDILKSLQVPIRIAGIDEAYLDVTSIAPTYEDARHIGLKIKADVLDTVNLTVSVGIGPTLKIAKMASDYQKPDGITVVKPDQLDSFFDKLPLIKIPGIGKKTYERLLKKGFETCDQLKQLNEADIAYYLGSMGLYFYEILRGKSTNRIVSRGVRKSVSHSRTFIGKPGDIDTSKAVLDKLFKSSYETLVKEKFLTKTVSLRIRFNGFDTITRAQSLPVHTNDRDQLYEIVNSVVSPYLSDARGIRLIGVGFSNLKKIEDSQLRLDEFISEDTKSTGLVQFISQNNVNPNKTKDKADIPQGLDIYF